MGTANNTLGLPIQVKGASPPLSGRVRVFFEPARPRHLEATLDWLLHLEERVYEPARRVSREEFRLLLTQPETLFVVAELPFAEARDRGLASEYGPQFQGPEDQGLWTPVGCALAAPLECFAGLAGPAQDPQLAKEDTIYSHAVTVDPNCRGLRLGSGLKRAQVEAAARVRVGQGYRYRFLSGRNRIGATAAMRHINKSLGAAELYRLPKAYADGGSAVYYRIDLAPFREMR